MAEVEGDSSLNVRFRVVDKGAAARVEYLDPSTPVGLTPAQWGAIEESGARVREYVSRAEQFDRDLAVIYASELHGEWGARANREVAAVHGKFFNPAMGRYEDIPLQQVDASQLLVRDPSPLSGAVSRSTIVAVKEAVDAGAHAEDASAPARDAFGSGEAAGRALTTPFTGGGGGNGADPLEVGLKLALGEHVGGFLRDELAAGWEIAFPTKDFTGRDYPNHAQAVGGNLAAGAAFTTGLLTGLTAETAKGAVSFFIDPAKAAGSDLVEDVKRALEAERERRHEVYLPVGGIGQDDIRGGVRPSSGFQLPEFPRGPSAAQQEHDGEHEGTGPDVAVPLSVANGYGAGAVDDEESSGGDEQAAAHVLPRLTVPDVPIEVPGLDVHTAAYFASLPSPPSSVVSSPSFLGSTSGGLSSPPVAAAAGAFPGTTMSSILGTAGGVLGVAKDAAQQALETAKENPGVTAGVLGATGAAAVGTGLLIAASRDDSPARTSSSSSKRSSSKKKRSSSKKRAPMRRAKSVKGRVPAKRAKKGKREDRRGVTRNTYRGQPVMTHKGRHYVVRKRAEKLPNGRVMPAGTWKFINS